MAAPIGNFQLELEKALKSQLSLHDIKCLNESKEENKVFSHLKKYSLCDIDWVKAYFLNCDKFHTKSEEEASTHRECGNKLFQQKCYQDGVERYTEAVVQAPPSCAQLALAYGNRSAALYRLKRYEECVSDIEAAVETGYPGNNLHKLLLRKAHCLAALGKSEDLETCIHHLEENINSTEMEKSKKESVLKELRDIKDNSKSVIDSYRLEDVEMPEVSYGPNPVVTQASACVELQHSVEKGRYLTTKEDIMAGDTLIVERPYAGVLLPEHYSTHCHHCYGKTILQYPCAQCTLVRYCSRVCSQESWRQYHHVECRYLKLLHSVGIAHLSLRVILVAGLEDLLDFRSVCQERSPGVAGLDAEGRYSRNYLTVYDLMTHVDDMTPQDLFQYTMTAQLLLKMLQHSGWFNESKQTPNQTLASTGAQNNTSDSNNQAGCGNDLSDTNGSTPSCDVEDYIGGLLLRHILQLVCNAHAITELQYTDTGISNIVEQKSQVRIATAIYPTASLMNHSCDPTIISSFRKDLLVVRSVKDVEKGGEIFNCYGPHHRRMGYTERQRCLREQYFFTCVCEPCRQGGELEKRFNSYRCTECQGPVCEKESTGTYSCIECEADVPVDIQAVEQADKLFQAALSYLEQNQYKAADSALRECLSIRLQHLFSHNKQLAETYDCLARCLASQGQFVKSASYLQKSIDIIEKVYGETSIETANELHKLSELQISAQDWKVALSTNQKAAKLFELHYGKSHDTVKELASARNELLEVIKALNL